MRRAARAGAKRAYIAASPKTAPADGTDQRPIQSGGTSTGWRSFETMESGDMRYIALLRGVNVGGHMVKMERLRALFAELGLDGVRTYIQSGNVFFEAADGDRAELTRAIERHLRAALGLE